MMTKLGVDNNELLAELRKRYNDLKDRQAKLKPDMPVQKEASASIQKELDSIQSKIDELTSAQPQG